MVEGQMIAPTIRATRTNSEELVCYVAGLEGIKQSTLGNKDRCGKLKSMKSRQEFLSDKSHRVRFVYLPKHSSWLNQIETILRWNAGASQKAETERSVDLPGQEQ